MGFWRNFWYNLKRMGETPESDKVIKTQVQDWEDVIAFNPLDIIVQKLVTLSQDEATFEIRTDSKLAVPLMDVTAALEKKRYEICGMMLGKGGCYVTLATDDNGKEYVRVLSPDDVSVYTTTGDSFTEIGLIIDKKTVKSKTYYLVRHHFLDNNNLYIYYYTTDKSGRKVYFSEWKHFENDNVIIRNANNIGIAYFKSPKDSRGLSQLFGVPLNFGCEEIEKQIAIDRQAVADEMKNAEMLLFADESIVRADMQSINGTLKATRWKLPEKLFTIRKKAGVDGTLIDYFAPSTRYTDYKDKLLKTYAEYEDSIGVNRGFLTPSETTGTATATEIRTANIKTVSMVKRIQAAMDDGIRQAVQAAAMFMQINPEMFDISIDWYDVFNDETTQWERLKQGVDYGAVEVIDLVTWLFPSLTEEEKAEKLARISAQAQTNTDQALERILQGG